MHGVSGEQAAGFVSGKVDESARWTLTTRAGEFLADAEAKYGPRDPGYTFIGIEFYGDIPQTWFPGDRKHVAIRLSYPAASEPSRALFQLAHEVVHLLAPNPGTSAPVLEEGLATIHQQEWSTRLGLNMNVKLDGQYAAAAALVRAVIASAPDVIRRVRKIQPMFSATTPALLESVGVSPTLTAALTAPFNSWQP